MSFPRGDGGAVGAEAPRRGGGLARRGVSPGARRPCECPQPWAAAPSGSRGLRTPPPGKPRGSRLSLGPGPWPRASRTGSGRRRACVHAGGDRSPTGPPPRPPRPASPEPQGQGARGTRRCQEGPRFGRRRRLGARGDPTAGDRRKPDGGNPWRMFKGSEMDAGQPGKPIPCVAPSNSRSDPQTRAASLRCALRPPGALGPPCCTPGARVVAGRRRTRAGTQVRFPARMRCCSGFGATWSGDPRRRRALTAEEGASPAFPRCFPKRSVRAEILAAGFPSVSCSTRKRSHRRPEHRSSPYNRAGQHSKFTAPPSRCTQPPPVPLHQEAQPAMPSSCRASTSYGLPVKKRVHSPAQLLS
ncbi:collagen alpha-1(I) chain-like [Pteropus medius]|uniref:collagen alpha-1(I) chain-like n=1 Tax=Pteropus vampyrus TaxID=132908 RepID=UPI00196A8AAB|nr:collagen alpha-1(I) chain-like [Pteropus giganteus]